MTKEIALEVKDVCVTYQSVKKASIRDILKNRQERKTVNALRSVSFAVEKGEILGIIGENGSGKSTLLRTIAGAFVPDSGTIDKHGLNCSLLAIGIGFNNNLSGRENIVLSGLLLGIPMGEIKEKEDMIIEYSELGDFIDYPVRTYSSGMYSKLAFSITALLKTDIILIDEILSVGDEQFRKKSQDTILEMIADENRTVILVSHNLEQIRSFCSTVLWLSHGEIRASGDPDTVIGQYLRSIKKK